MALTKPRIAVAYHFFNDFDTLPDQIAQVRQTYDGPLSMATDYMVWNVTKDDIRVRMAVIDEDIWPQPAVQEKQPPDRSIRIGFSDFILSGREAFTEIVQKIYDEINAEYGTDYEVPTD